MEGSASALPAIGGSNRNDNQKGIDTMAMQSTTRRSFSQRWEDYQPSKTILFWACVAAVVATIIVGFNWGGWVTGGTSRTAATAAADAARGDLASAICVERFKAAPDAAAKLVEFKAIADSYKKRQFVEAGGWATMPGQTKADQLGLQECTNALGA
jgi:hypothetical protein